MHFTLFNYWNIIFTLYLWRVAPEASAKIGCRPLLLLRLSHSHPHQPPLWPQRFIAKLWRRRSYNLLGRESYYSLAACSAGEKCLKRPRSAGEGTKRFPQGLKIRRKFDTVGNVRRESVLKGHVHVTCPKCLVFWTPSLPLAITKSMLPPLHSFLRADIICIFPLKWIYCCLGTIHSFLEAHADSVIWCFSSLHGLLFRIPNCVWSWACIHQVHQIPNIQPPHHD